MTVYRQAREPLKLMRDLCHNLPSIVTSLAKLKVKEMFHGRFGIMYLRMEVCVFLYVRKDVDMYRCLRVCSDAHHMRASMLLTESEHT